MTIKLTNLSDGSPKSNTDLVECKHCSGTGNIGKASCPMCNGMGKLTKAKARKQR